MIKIVIIGFGVIGRGVFEVLLEKKQLIEKYIGKYSIIAVTERTGAVYSEKGLGIDILDFKSSDFSSGSTMDIIENIDFDVAIEVTPTDIKGGEPGLTHIRECLRKGSHVITSNKGPIVVAYRELQKIADKNNVKFMFEATVGGGMPLINLVRNNLVGNRVDSIRGILNGTCNYILSRMESERLSYHQVLAEAQELGIAEADPTYDVEGIDSAAKVVIIANALLDMNVSFDDVEIEGITSITPEAFDVALEKDFTIRLIAEVDKVADSVRVSPRLVPLHHPLSVKGTLNAVQIRTDLARDIVIIGRGAGQRETSSAIISDLIEIYRK
ncbi:MAG TPA: homoserine dehydrogenase [Archaeoglobaceae archaeon]|nr:homoserine dehydrogenase [Archaeoglobaceae archaeon]